VSAARLLDGRRQQERRLPWGGGQVLEVFPVLFGQQPRKRPFKQDDFADERSGPRVLPSSMFPDLKGGEQRV
jgi:hypothetical protein